MIPTDNDLKNELALNGEYEILILENFISRYDELKHLKPVADIISVQKALNNKNTESHTSSSKTFKSLGKNDVIFEQDFENFTDESLTDDIAKHWIEKILEFKISNDADHNPWLCVYKTASSTTIFLTRIPLTISIGMTPPAPVQYVSIDSIFTLQKTHNLEPEEIIRTIETI